MKIKARTYTRKKKAFKTERLAWADVLKKMRQDFRGVRTAHTATEWRFNVV